MARTPYTPTSPALQQPQAASPLAAAILITWRRNGAYAARLMQGVTDAALTAQPPGLAPTIVLNHPAWILSHLNLYAGVAARLAAGLPFDDPASHRHGQSSVPEPAADRYDTRDALVRDWAELHAQGERALLAATPEVLAAATPVDRWRALHPTVGDMLVTLMVKHEAHHLGQLSTWRRAMGLASVAM